MDRALVFSSLTVIPLLRACEAGEPAEDTAFRDTVQTAEPATMPAYVRDSTLAATKIGYNVPGYDAENNDWWWLKRTADGEVEAAGHAHVGGQQHLARSRHA